MTANTGRPDLDALIKFSAVPTDEPVFLVRAQDDGGADAVQDWAARAYARGVPVAVIEQALQQADRMTRWPSHKSPDADHLTVDERKRLEQQFRRRAWTAGIDAIPRLDLVLAHQRGRTEAEGLIRDLVRALEGADLSLMWRTDLHGGGGAYGDADAHAALMRFRQLTVLPTLERARLVAAAPLTGAAIDV